MAAQTFTVDIDLIGNALRNALLDPVASDPVSPANGQIWYNSSSNVWKIRAGGATVVLGRLDQISAPTASVDLNGQKITNLGTPTLDADAVTKLYVDNLIAGAKWKTPEARVSTAGLGNITLSGTQTVDGVALSVGDRVLVTDQSATADNGLYVVASGAWTRTTDANTWDELVSAAVFVRQGTTNADKGFVCSIDAGGTLGVTAITWSQFTGGAAYTASLGVTKVGNDFRFDYDNTTLNLDGSNKAQIKDLGVATGKIADDAVTNAKLANMAADTIKGRANGAGTGDPTDLTAAQVRTILGLFQTYSANVGDGASNTITITHNLGTKDVVVQLYRNSSPWDTVGCTVERPTTNTVDLKFNGSAPASNAYRVVIQA
jgi:hypothetical protein